MESYYKEVDFETYCKQCRWSNKTEDEYPCDECLETGAREFTKKPERYEPGDKIRRKSE